MDTHSPKYKTFLVEMDNIKKITQYIDQHFSSRKRSVFDHGCYMIESFHKVATPCGFIITEEFKEILVQSLTRSGYIINWGKTTVKYIIYNLNEVGGKYSVENHKDNNKDTIILYLDKDESISDTFHIEGVKIKNRWKKRGFIMLNRPVHGGTFKGSGLRKIICIFIE